MTVFPRILSLVGMLISLAPADAHEFWIEPSPARPAVGETLRIGLWLGERLAGDSVLFDPDRCAGVEMHGPGGVSRVVGRSGGSALFARADAPGTHVIAYRSRIAYSALPADRFDAYLREEGLESIVAQRRRRGESDRPGRERYLRCAKALVSVVTADERCAQPVGLDVEIVPEAQFAALRAGGTLKFTVLHDGRPLPAASIVAVSQQDPQNLHRAKTDGRGNAEMCLPSDGPWLLTTVHMTRARDDSNADWQSVWASLWLYVPDAAAPSSPE